MISDILFILLQTLTSIYTCVWNFISNLLISLGVESWFGGNGGPTMTLDTGIRIRVGKQIAEGGFSYVFEAYSINDNTSSSSRKNKKTKPTKYALKRIMCHDDETLRTCRKEAKVHRNVGHHRNLMSLAGMSIIKDTRSTSVCYMLFEYLPHSLRSEVNQRILPDNPSQPRTPFDELSILQIFVQLLDGVQTLHNANFTHRDIKLENVLLKKNIVNNMNKFIPILMDFGSAGSAKPKVIKTRQSVLTIIDEASQHTTIPYRPPELFDGGIRAGDDDLDYREVDVWSLGCVLFAIMYGASPFEMEFTRSGDIRIVDCTHLKILSDIPSLPKEALNTPISSWYASDNIHHHDDDLLDIVRFMLNKDRLLRPTLSECISKVESRIVQLGDTPANKETKRHHHRHDVLTPPSGDIDDLLSNQV